MGKTSDNLQDAFAGESQASRKYTYFAEKADEEGHKQIARLFRAASDAETVHARNHLKVMGEIKSTKDNLKAAIGGEHHEFIEMYPAFMKQADAEGNNKAKDSFDLANKVEQIHHSLYKKALDMVEKGKAVSLDALIGYQDGAVVSRTVIDKPVGTVTMFSFDEGEGLSEHTAPYDAMVLVVDGEAEVTVAGKANAVRAGEMIILPAGRPHALRAASRFKMLLVMIRA